MAETRIARPRQQERNGKKRSHDPLGDELRRRALQFTDELVQEAGVILARGMRGELPGSDAKEQRLCAQAIRAERIPSASSQPTIAPRVEVVIAPFARIDPMRARLAGDANPQAQRGDSLPLWSASTVGQRSDGSDGSTA